MSVRLENGSFYGRAGESIRFEDVLLTETSYRAGFAVPQHAHAHPFFCFLVDGRMREHFDKRSLVLSRHTGFYHPAEADHAETFDHGPARLFNMQFGASWLRAVTDADVRLPRDHVILPDGRAALLAVQLHAEFAGGRERLVVEGLLIAMLGMLVSQDGGRERSGTPAWMGNVLERLHAGLTESVGLAELAQLAGVHPSSVARAFRMTHGCTVGEYVRRLRVQRAGELLGTGDMPLSRVAATCGFADQSHLTRVFRRAMGVTPLVYRRELRGRQ